MNFKKICILALSIMITGCASTISTTRTSSNATDAMALCGAGLDDNSRIYLEGALKKNIAGQFEAGVATQQRIAILEVLKQNGIKNPELFYDSYLKCIATMYKIPEAYTQEEIGKIREKFRSDAISIGGILIQTTHPTGKFNTVELANVQPSSVDSRELILTIATSWTGGLIGTPYKTVFQFSKTKWDSVKNLVVISDTALTQIAPQKLREAEILLRSQF
jgi:hypothetical protein